MPYGMFTVCYEYLDFEIVLILRIRIYLGQLKKIITGKQRGENVLLLRNLDGGPILLSIYYDFALVGLDSGLSAIIQNSHFYSYFP